MSSFSQKKVYQILFVLVLIGTFLRFYNLADFAIFLGDQGRDAIIMKRIVMFEHFPAVGPSSSVGQVYLGPFYYYFMAPWLSLFNMNPVGPVFGVAFLSTLFIALIYLMVADLFGKKIALLASGLVAFSSVLVVLSRFSWNPNILPMFSFISIYFFIKSLSHDKKMYYLLTGLFAGFAFQLHYVTFSLLFAYVVVALYKKRSISFFTYAFMAFATVNAPLIFFDLRHNFLNAKNLATLFSKPDAAGATSLQSLYEGITSLNSYAFSVDGYTIIMMLIFLALLLSVRYIKDTNYRVLCVIFVLTLIPTSFMTAQKFPHYFGILYPMYYVLLAVVVIKLSTQLIIGNKNILPILFVAGFAVLQSFHYPFLHSEPNKQILHAEQTAKKIFPLITKDKFRLTAIPDTYGYSAYGYFIELWGKKPIDNLTLEPSDEMIVVCENNCQPIGNPQWDIAFFAAKSIESSVTSDNIFIYKLVK